MEKNKTGKRIGECWGEVVEILNKMVRNGEWAISVVMRSPGGKNILGTRNTG